MADRTILFSRVITAGVLVCLSLTVPIFFGSIVFLISRFGWVELAEAHPAGQRPTDGVSFYGCSGTAGQYANYGGCLEVTLSQAGVYVVPNWFFQWGHAPLQLPWSDVQSLTESSSQPAGRVMIRFVNEGGRKLALSLPASASSDARTLSGQKNFLGTTIR